MMPPSWMPNMASVMTLPVAVSVFEVGVVLGDDFGEVLSCEFGYQRIEADECVGGHFIRFADGTD